MVQQTHLGDPHSAPYLRLSFYNEAGSGAFLINYAMVQKACTRHSVFQPGDCLHEIIIDADDLEPWVAMQLANLKYYIDRYHTQDTISEEEVSDSFAPYLKMVNDLVILLYNYVGKPTKAYLDEFNQLVYDFYNWALNLNDKVTNVTVMRTTLVANEFNFIPSIKPLWEF